MKRKPNGFTLIELIITLAIIGLLSALIYPNFAKIQQNAKATTLKTTTHTIQMAIESYFLNQGAYPEGENIAITQLINTLKTTGDLTKIPTNPFTGKAYTDADASGKITYSYNSDENRYTLQAYGQNNQSIIITLENI